MCRPRPTDEPQLSLVLVGGARRLARRSRSTDESQLSPTDESQLFTQLSPVLVSSRCATFTADRRFPVVVCLGCIANDVCSAFHLLGNDASNNNNISQTLPPSLTPAPSRPLAPPTLACPLPPTLSRPLLANKKNKNNWSARAVGTPEEAEETAYKNRSSFFKKTQETSVHPMQSVRTDIGQAGQAGATSPSRARRYTRSDYKSAIER